MSAQKTEDSAALQKYYDILVHATTHHPKIFDLGPRKARGKSRSLLLRIVDKVKGR